MRVEVLGWSGGEVRGEKERREEKRRKEKKRKEKRRKEKRRRRDKPSQALTSSSPAGEWSAASARFA